MSENGEIRAYAAGTATVTASSPYMTRVASVNIEVLGLDSPKEELTTESTTPKKVTTVKKEQSLRILRANIHIKLQVRILWLWLR